MPYKRYTMVPHSRLPGYFVAREALTEGEPPRDEGDPFAWLDRQYNEAQLLARGIEPRLAAQIRAASETAAIKAARDLAHGPRLFLVLAGGVGTGKTTAAAKAVAEWPEHARLVKAIDLARHGLYGAENRGFWEGLEAASLIAIDDLGTEPKDEKGFTLALFADLLDKRYDAGRKTIITCNLEADRFKAVYGGGESGRLTDRVRERGRFLHVGGPSMRRPEVA